MWYAYEGENDLIAVKASDVKAIIDMNRQQQYPERLEDYQVELMSTSALAQESTDEEVEREMRRLSEGGDGVVDDSAPAPRPERRDNRKSDNRPRREGQGDRQPKKRPERQDQPQQGQQNRERRNNKPKTGDQPRRSGGGRDRRN